MKTESGSAESLKQLSSRPEPWINIPKVNNVVLY